MTDSLRYMDLTDRLCEKRGRHCPRVVIEYN
jgi:hypothetical protein